MKEDNGTPKCVTLFTLKSESDPTSDVCLYFGTDEYKGLPPNTYTLDTNTRILFDSDHDKIEIRNLIYFDIDIDTDPTPNTIDYFVIITIIYSHI